MEPPPLVPAKECAYEPCPDRAILQDALRLETQPAATVDGRKDGNKDMAVLEVGQKQAQDSRTTKEPVFSAEARTFSRLLGLL